MDLTEGAIAKLVGGAKSEEINPVVQVTDLRLVNTSNTQKNTGERYRMLISDGSQQMQGMLGTNRNDLVKTGKLLKGSVIRMTQFICNSINNRLIIIIIDLDVLLEKCDLIGEPAPESKSSGPTRSSTDQPGTATGNPQSFGGNLFAGGLSNKTNVGGASLQHPGTDHGNSYSGNADSGRYGGIKAPRMYTKAESGAGLFGSEPSSGSYGDHKMGIPNPRAGGSRSPLNTYTRPPQSGYQQPPPMYSNRGPVARNEAAPRIIPIAALNPYQGRWTIKARVTAKGDVRHYNNPRGDGKVFSFDLLDSDGGEIRVTCFNAVADQFYNQIEVGKVYMISKGNLKPAQRTFNHLNHDHEIFLESTSTIQPCIEDDSSIPQQQFHFRPISEVEGMENNSVVDVIGVVSSISPSASIMRKNGTETQKRSLQLKDMSGRSVELTLWGNFCNTEGQKLQNMCDSGTFPVLAVKSGRVSDFIGKSVGTISTSQLFIEPDFPEARRLKDWFDKEGRNTPSVSISREASSVGRTDTRKTISQIKDERLGTSEKPDWIIVSATVSFIKTDTFCYTACPIMIGDRQCSKKVTNNGDGKWLCDRCDKSIDEPDYRYILQFQIQDHTGLTWVTAFQESGMEIMGISAKDLYYIKFEEQDDERFAEVIRKVLFNKYIFKLKVKEETFSDEQRVKSTVVKADTVNFSSESKFLLGLMDKLKADDSGSFASKAYGTNPNIVMNNVGIGNPEYRQVAPPAVNYTGNSSSAGREFGVPANQVGQYGNPYSSSRPSATVASGVYVGCNSCGGTGHSSSNCPSIMNGPGQSMGGGYGNRISPGAGAGGVSGECYKCHQPGHWARDCPGLSSVPPAYGSSGVNPGGYGGVRNQQVGF